MSKEAESSALNDRLRALFASETRTMSGSGRSFRLRGACNERLGTSSPVEALYLRAIRAERSGRNALLRVTYTLQTPLHTLGVARFEPLVAPLEPLVARGEPSRGAF